MPPLRPDRPPLQGPVRVELVERTRALLARRALPQGAHLSELELSRALGVSRTPVRNVLLALEQEGSVEFRPGRGFFMVGPVARPTATGEQLPGDTQALFQAIARDRLAGVFPERFLESDLMRRYDVSRFNLTRVLRQMAEVGIVERTAGHGWLFLPSLETDEANEQSIRFRMSIEPAALLEPGFALDETWTNDIIERHERALRAPWSRFSSVEFFEMNAEFHEGLARASGNPFFHMAVRHQNRLRRFINYHWQYGPERVLVSVREHLEIIEHARRGDSEWAASLMRRHIEMADRDDVTQIGKTESGAPAFPGVSGERAASRLDGVATAGRDKQPARRQGRRKRETDEQER